MCNLFNVLPYTIGNSSCCRTFPNELISRCGDDVDGDGSLGSLHDLGRRHPGAPAAPCAVAAAAVVHARAARRPRLYCLPCRYEEIDEQVGIAIDAPQACKLELPRACVDKVCADYRPDVAAVRRQWLNEAERPVVRKVEVRCTVRDDRRSTGAAGKNPNDS